MKYGYKELKGKCKTCYLKCFRLEPLEFNGVERCEYYTEEEENDRENDRERISDRDKKLL